MGRRHAALSFIAAQGWILEVRYCLGSCALRGLGLLEIIYPDALT